MPARQFVVYTRDGCLLCDEFISELAGITRSFTVRDVDADAKARRRFGLKLPVLTLDGSVVCHGRLDHGAVRRLIRD